MKFTNKADGTVVEAITFDELVEFGRKKEGVNIVNGMPWSFNYKFFPVTHENDQCYIVTGAGGKSMSFTPQDMLVELPGACVEVHDKAVFHDNYSPNSVTFEQLHKLVVEHESTSHNSPLEFHGLAVRLIYDRLHIYHPDGIKAIGPGDVLTFTPHPPPTPTKVTPDQITAAIEHTYFFTGDRATQGAPQHPSLKLITFCILILKNGFMVTGESACAHPDTFDATIGRQLAYDNARDKIWPLLGYQLKQRLYDATSPS